MSACSFKENIDLIRDKIGGTYANMLIEQYEAARTQAEALAGALQWCMDDFEEYGRAPSIPKEALDAYRAAKGKE